MDKIYDKASILGVAPYLNASNHVVGTPSDEVWFSDTTRKIGITNVKANTIVFAGELPLVPEWGDLEIKCNKAIIKNKAVLDDLSGNSHCKLKAPHIVIAYDDMRSDPIGHKDSIVERVLNMIFMKDIDNDLLETIEVDLSKFNGTDEELSDEVRRVLTYHSRAPRYCDIYELEALKQLVNSICKKPSLMTSWISKHMKEIDLQLAIKKKEVEN